MHSQEILTGIRDFLNEATANYWTDADLYRKMNLAHQTMVDELIDAGQGYFRRSTNITYVANTDAYALPKNLARVEKIERVDGSDPIEILPITLSQEAEYRNTAIHGTSFADEGYQIEAENVRLVPTPTGAITNALRIRYAKAQPLIHSGVPTASANTTITFAVAPLRGTITLITDAYEGWNIYMSDTGDRRKITAFNSSTRVATVDAAWSVNPLVASVYALIPEIPERWHDILVLRASVAARIEKFDEATDLQSMLAPIELTYKNALKPRQTQQSRRVNYVSP